MSSNYRMLNLFFQYVLTYLKWGILAHEEVFNDNLVISISDYLYFFIINGICTGIDRNRFSS